MTDKEQLFQSIRLKNFNTFESLISHADINVTDSDGQNLIHEAIASQTQRIALELIQRGIDVNHQDINGQTPLHFTAVFNDQLVASEIIHNGGNLEIADNYGNTPLWTAVFNARGNYELVRLFLKNGANSLHKNNAGRSPLDFALQIKDEILVKLLSA